MKYFKLLFYLLTLLILPSCFKEDEKVVPYIPGNVQTTTITMEEDYKIMSFFNLSEGKVIDSSIKYNWDLAITTESDDYFLHLNTSLFMKAAHTGAYEFDSVYTITNDLTWEFDSSDGDLSKNAIGIWWLTADSSVITHGEVLIIDRGIDFEGFPLGYVKVQPVLIPESKTVEIRVSNLDNTAQRSFTYTRDNRLAIETMSFDSGINELQPFPPANMWDLWFTQYTTLLFTNEGEAYPYLVTGVLINRENIQVALDTIHPFNEVTREIAEKTVFSKQLDIIGYDWKMINGDVTSGDITYVARTNYTYIINTSQGYYYKLRFIDFYNNEGKKGYPKFEYQRL